MLIFHLFYIYVNKNNNSYFPLKKQNYISSYLSVNILQIRQILNHIYMKDDPNNRGGDERENTHLYLLNNPLCN